MTLLPRSLFGRHALLIVALVVLGQLAGLLLMRQLILRPRFEQLGDSVARDASAIRAGLMALPADQRQGFVDRFNQRALAALPTDADSGSLRAGMLTPLERQFVRRISLRVGEEGMQVVWRREAGGSLALRLPIEGNAYWVVLPGILRGREVTGAWIAATIAGAALALLGALLIQRHMNLPLRRLVEAAQTLAKGATPEVLPEDGPIEAAALSRSFNQLVASLAQTERERALMLAGVSHDLRTPLAKLRLGVEILGDREEPELMLNMTRSIAEMDQVVGQFLDFARGETDEPVIDGDLDALAGELGAAYADHGQPLILHLGRPPHVPMRPQALHRALTNLIENAWRHGSAPVGIRTGQDGESVWIEVSDEGPGIAAADAAALKQPFRRALPARSGAAGSGLGLAIAERVAREQAGRLELLANLPRGLRARISLPLRGVKGARDGESK